MRSHARFVPIALIAAAGTLLGGCANQRVDELESANRQLQARNIALSQENEARDSMLRDKDTRIVQLESERSSLQQRIDDLVARLRSLGGQYEELTGRLDRVRLGSLDPSTDAALRSLVSQYPNLITYNPDKGMVQFGSDLTFDSGSDVVRAEAKAGLAEFARILRSSSAASYDVRVIGHTDDVQPARTRDRFPTNRHLSMARAISVARELEGAGVPGRRIETAGWGEYRPAVPNNPSGGTRANRRVEIYLVAGTGEGIEVRSSTRTGESAPAPRTAPQRDVPMK